MARSASIFFILLISFCFSATGYSGLSAWTSPYRMALGGSGLLLYSSASSHANPSAIYKDRIFSTGLIRYPAGITSQSLATNIPREKGVAGFSVSHISYGIFDGYDDEANPTSDYYSSDTWIKANYSAIYKNSPFQYGSAISFFSSNLNEAKTRTFLISTGGQLYFKKIKTNVGIGFQNYSIKKIRLSGNGYMFPHRINISISKDLAYLPMKIFFDVEQISRSKNINIYLGGQVDATPSIKFLWGTSSKKIEHNIQQNLWKTLLGASGLGFIYLTETTKIIYGLYIFGTGSIVQGIELEFSF